MAPARLVDLERVAALALLYVLSSALAGCDDKERFPQARQWARRKETR